MQLHLWCTCGVAQAQAASFSLSQTVRAERSSPILKGSLPVFSPRCPPPQVYTDRVPDAFLSPRKVHVYCPRCQSLTSRRHSSFRAVHSQSGTENGGGTVRNLRPPIAGMTRTRASSMSLCQAHGRRAPPSVARAISAGTHPSHREVVRAESGSSGYLPRQCTNGTINTIIARETQTEGSVRQRKRGANTRARQPLSQVNASAPSPPRKASALDLSRKSEPRTTRHPPEPVTRRLLPQHLLGRRRADSLECGGTPQETGPATLVRPGLALLVHEIDLAR